MACARMRELSGCEPFRSSASGLFPSEHPAISEFEMLPPSRNRGKGNVMLISLLGILLFAAAVALLFGPLPRGSQDADWQWPEL